MKKENKTTDILVVENDEAFFLFLQYFSQVADVDIEWTWAMNGAEALEKTKKDKFDAILMNIEMPYGDGITTTQVLRAQGYTTPIIAWTCHNKDYMGEICKNAGMDDFIEKDCAHLIEDVVSSLDRVGVHNLQLEKQ